VRDVKSPPGTRRAEQASATRGRILDAARQRFAERGYAATTFRDIADHAAVAVQTVYAIFGTKATILRTLRESVSAEPGAGAAYAAALAATDPTDALRAFSRSIRLRWERGHDIVGIDLNAASADVDVRAEVAAVLTQRRRGISRLAARLHELDQRIDQGRSGALLNAVTLPQLYEELVTDHGWSADDYESWLTRTLVDQTLDFGGTLPKIVAMRTIGPSTARAVHPETLSRPKEDDTR
jgi:AcrR family transcriptional regulator